MFQTYGLYGHIQANRLRSVLLLAGFVLLLQMLQFSLYLLLEAFLGYGNPFETIARDAFNHFRSTWPIATLIAAAWFAIAYASHHFLIRFATGAKPVTRKEAPQLYNALENLCISRGIPMPRLEIMETPGLNAYAAGLREGDYVVAVTRGLIDRLGPEELEAVLAHELTHIKNRDTQMMVIAIIFAGIFAFFADLFIRPWDFPYGVYPRDRRRREQEAQGGTLESSDDRSDDNRSGGGSVEVKGGGGAAIAVVVAIVIIVITWGVSTVIRFALSRSREYLADAGAVELTKDPDALISALSKIARNPKMPVISRMEAFCIESPLTSKVSGVLSTHPAMSDRIAAIRRYAGGSEAAATTT